MFFECFGGKLFENGKRYTKSETTIQKVLEERIPNHILHVQFERKISVSQSNLYVYNYLKRQKMPKRVKIFTSKWHRKQEHLLIHPFRSLQCILFVEKNFFLSRTSLPEPILCKEGGVEFSTMPPSGPPLEFWLDQTDKCTTWLWGLQYKIIFGSLWYLATEEMR